MKNKMEIVGRKISFAEAEDADILFWADKTMNERLIEWDRLRRIIWTKLLGTFPTKMEVVGRKILKSEMSEDVF
jgi:hypothetical protein